SSDELLRALIQKTTTELKHNETLLELQELRTKNEQLKQETREAVWKLKDLELKTKMVSEEKNKVERQWKLALDQAGQNTQRCLGENFNSFSQDRNNQYSTASSLRYAPPRATPVPKGMEKEPKSGMEKARAYVSLTKEIVESEGEEDDTGSKLNLLEGYWTSTPRAEARIKQGNENESLLEQILLAQAVPEPKPFSASERSISLETFKHTFAMKYRTLPVYDQLMLLESKFLEGKALQVFKGIPAREKTSVEKTFRALAERLRVSIQDESRMAKTRFERLRMRQGQTIEEFCLELDAIAEKAFGRNSPEEISSTKTAKLLVAMGELSDDYQLRSLMEWQLREIPEANQYDECRKFATVLEKGKLEMQKSRDKGKPNNQQAKQPSVLVQKLPSFRQNFMTEVPKRHETQSPNPIGLGETRVSFPTCYECGQIGCHLAACSKALSVNCFHYRAPVEQTQGQTLSVENLEKKKASASRGTGDTRVEIGKIGNTLVEFLIDSGSTISLISKATWNKLVKENGKEWQHQIPKTVPEINRVVAANNTNIELLLEAKIETIMTTRTREIIYHIADVQRDNVILGTNAFCDMGITMNIGGNVRDISLTKTVRMKPGESKTVEVQVEGLVLDEKKHCLVTPTTHFLSTTMCHMDEKGKSWLNLCNCENTPIILKKGAKVATGELKESNVSTEVGKVDEVVEMCIEAGASDIDDKGVLCSSGSIDGQLTQVQSMEGEVEEVLEMWIEAGDSDIDDKGNTEIEKVITEKTRDQALWKQVERDKPIVAGDIRKLITKHKAVLAISNYELGQTNLTKYAIAVPILDKNAQTVEKTLTERCALEEWRVPDTLPKGKEKEFEICQFQQPSEMLHIKQVPTRGDDSRKNDRDSKNPIIMEGEDAAGIVFSNFDKNAKVLTQKLLKSQRFAKNHAERGFEGNICWYVKKGKEKTRKFPIVGKRVPVQSTTTSPTALQRFNLILRQNLYLVEGHAMVRHMALLQPLIVSHPVTKELYKALTRGPSIILTLKNTNLMREFEELYFMHLNDSVGAYVFDDTRTLFILLPGIIMEPSQLDVFVRRNIAFEVEKIPWWIHKLLNTFVGIENRFTNKTNCFKPLIVMCSY
uniref:Peptidase A2 domain-containing protein n=1 Tax=Caenorhabditis japonica TaxID=281687 RepID=A0A8R1IV19_CAEJA